MLDDQEDYLQLELVGYFPKITTVPPGWREAVPLPEIAEICSVSNCLNPSPEVRMDRWVRNELGFFNNPTDARSVVWPHHEGFVLFAYRLLPRVFFKGDGKAYGIPTLLVEPLAQSFNPIGFDVVSKSTADFFECSPLSCNHMAAEVAAVNRYCLVNTLAEAVSLAERFSREEPEPGPYYVLEVFRQPG